MTGQIELADAALWKFSWALKKTIHFVLSPQSGRSAGAISLIYKMHRDIYYSRPERKLSIRGTFTKTLS